MVKFIISMIPLLFFCSAFLFANNVGAELNWHQLCRAQNPSIRMAGPPGKVLIDFDMPLWVIGIPSELHFHLNFDRSKGVSCFKIGANTRTRADKVFVSAIEFDKERAGRKFTCRADMVLEHPDGNYAVSMTNLFKIGTKNFLNGFMRRMNFNGDQKIGNEEENKWTKFEENEKWDVVEESDDEKGNGEEENEMFYSMENNIYKSMENFSFRESGTRKKFLFEGNTEEKMNEHVQQHRVEEPEESKSDSNAEAKTEIDELWKGNKKAASKVGIGMARRRRVKILRKDAPIARRNGKRKKSAQKSGIQQQQNGEMPSKNDGTAFQSVQAIVNEIVAMANRIRREENTDGKDAEFVGNLMERLVHNKSLTTILSQISVDDMLGSGKLESASCNLQN